MKTAGSVTTWLRALEVGDDDAAKKLWDRYSTSLHAVAKRRMRRLKQRDIVDEEDIVISAFADFCLAARSGRLEGIASRDELWGLLVVVTNRKVGQRIQYTSANKRASVSLVDQQVRNNEIGSRLERLVAASPTPERQAQLTEQADQLLVRLNDPDLQAIAVLRLAGYTNDEIAAEMGFSRRTILRMLSLIRTCWKEFDIPDGDSSS